MCAETCQHGGPCVLSRTRGLDWFHAQERQRCATQQSRGARASRQMNMTAQDLPQPALLLKFQAGETNRLVVASIAGGISQHVSQPAGHPGAKIDADWAYNNRDSGCHVLAAMLAHAFDDC